MSLLSLVNPLQGTKSCRHFSNGNTLPLIQRPFGMTAFVPQTAEDSSSRWFFHPDDRRVDAVRLTHQPSPWIGDYGCFAFLPQTGIPQSEPARRASGYSPADAVFSPAYLKLSLLRSRSVLEITPTERGAAFRLRIRDDRPRYLSFFSCGAHTSYRLEGNRLYGETDYHTWDDAKNFKTRLLVEFDGGIDPAATITEDEGSTIHVALTGQELCGRLAISYIDFASAERTLARENAVGFDAVRAEGEAVWESYLSRVEADFSGPDADKRARTFCTCLWRGFLFPHKCYEYDEAGHPIHYSPALGDVRPGFRYTDNGFWDTYRTVYPFFALCAVEEYREMLEGFIGEYSECGWLPRWLSIGEVGCMPSTLIDAVLADAAVKGILEGELLERAFEGMLHHAENESANRKYGRNGAAEYAKYGYVPYDEQKESVNLTLDAAYGDFCIAEIAKILGRTEIEARFRARAENYKKLFDPATGFMRPRSREGAFRPDFSPTAWGRDYTEAAAWQTTFAVPHDLDGLAGLFGGREAILHKLDELFAAEPLYEVGGYGREIHEMTEFAACGLGQCSINNQPGFHLPYLFAAYGQQDKTDFWVSKICRELFSDEPDGFPGDEDNGSMALWYVFSVMGFYPLCPGKNEYIKGIRQADRIRILGRELTPDGPRVGSISLSPRSDWHMPSDLED